MISLFFVMFQKREIREKMKDKMETDKLQKIVLQEDKVVWMDKHEIWVNEHMFDIHSKKLEKGVYTFTGLYDEEETELVKKEKKAAENNNEQSKLLVHFFKLLPVFCHIATENLNISASNNSFNFLDSQHSVSQYKEIVTPPPQVC